MGIVLYLTAVALQEAIINETKSMPPIKLNAIDLILHIVGLTTQQQPRPNIIIHVTNSPLIL